jgi:hypothetical protein
MAIPKAVEAMVRAGSGFIPVGIKNAPFIVNLRFVPIE